MSQIENGHSSPTADVLMRLIGSGLGLPLTAFFVADDEVTEIAQLLSGASAAMRRRAVRIIRALVED